MLNELKYSCIDSSGEEIKGVISASDRMDALSKLKERGLTVIELVEKKTKERKSFSLKRGFGDQDLYNISRELSILLRSGIRIDKGFELLMNPSMKQEFKDILSLVLVDIKAGKEVAQAFSNTGRFTHLVVTMIRVGEAVGNLQSAFENIAQYYRFQIQYKGEIRNALTYPIFLIFASLMTLVFIFSFIVPRFFSIFGTDTHALPLPAKVLYTMSGLLSFTNLSILVGIIIAIVLLKKFHPSKVKLPNLYPYLLSFPLIGRLMLNLELSRFSSLCTPCFRAGLSLLRH